jgi:hypothetical protein
MVKAGRRSKGNSSLDKRIQIAYNTKDLGGSGTRVFNLRKIDGDVKFFQPIEGKNKINIIPFEIKSKNHPLVRQGQMEVGDLDYSLDIYVHRNIGPSESAVVCLKKTFGKPCPICEEAERLKKAGKEKEVAALHAKRRVYYNVEDVRRKPGVVQIFDVSHHLFEKELLDEARSGDEGEESIINFYDAEIGKVVNFRASKTSQGGFDFLEYKSFSFTERDEPIDDDLLASAISFDMCLNVLSYEEVQALLYGADEDDDEGEEEEQLKRKSAKKVGEEEEEEDKPSRKPPAKPKRKPVEDDDEEEEEEEDEEEEEKPSKKSSAKSGKPVANGKCPNGHKYGKDADEYEECEDCDLWIKCSKQKDAEVF